MLEAIQPTPTDPLWALTNDYRADERGRTFDFLIGVYRDEHGNTPIMKAVRDAEQRLADRSTTKTYPPLSGHDRFNDLVGELLLSDEALLARALTRQTVGGTGALRLLAELTALLNGDATVWVSDPGYVNHEPIFRAAGLQVRKYAYESPNGRLDADRICEALSAARKGDVVILHGCCHNPTGIDITPELWSALTSQASKAGWIPLVDSAYHGLGDGLEEDLSGLRYMAENLPELFVAASCSKNMGLYSERTGCVTVVTNDGRHKDSIAGTLQAIARRSYSMPPWHGAALAAEVLADPLLRASWHEELEFMRGRVVAARKALENSFLVRTSNAELIAIGSQKGMFSVLPLNVEQMRGLRRIHGVYGTDFGRVNLAGLNPRDADYVADAILAV